MAPLPYLSRVTLSSCAHQPPLAIQLATSGDDCTCVVETPDVLQVGYLQVALNVELPRISPRHHGLTHTSRYLREINRYGLSCTLARTTLTEAMEIFRQLFAATDLELTYWYDMGEVSGIEVLLGAKIMQNGRTIQFGLPDGDRRSNGQLWWRFTQAIIAREIFQKCEHIEPHQSHIVVGLYPNALDDLEDTLLQLTAAFSL